MTVLQVPYLHLDAIDVRIFRHVRTYGPIDEGCLRRRFPDVDLMERLERLHEGGLLRILLDDTMRQYAVSDPFQPQPRFIQWLRSWERRMDWMGPSKA